MSEVSHFNRLIQNGYPFLIFFSVLLTWHSVGQVNGFADFHAPGLEPGHMNRSPAQVQTACFPEHLNSLEVADSCTEENPQPKWRIDTNDKSDGAVVKVTDDKSAFLPKVKTSKFN